MELSKMSRCDPILLSVCLYRRAVLEFLAKCYNLDTLGAISPLTISPPKK